MKLTCHHVYILREFKLMTLREFYLYSYIRYINKLTRYIRQV
jgi:hypothetical protein